MNLRQIEELREAFYRKVDGKAYRPQCPFDGKGDFWEHRDYYWQQTQPGSSHQLAWMETSSGRWCWMAPPEGFKVQK